MSRRLTIADVAELAGVSYQTVSRVINEKPDVSPETRQRVLEIIEETGYRPSGLARGLATAHTATIGLVVPDIANPFFSDLAREIEQSAYKKGYSVFFCNTNEDPTREIDVLNTLEEKHVDGVIICGLRQENARMKKVLARLPAVVLVNRQLNGTDYPTVMIDNTEGAKQAVRHLVHLGRRSIGLLAGPKTSYSGACREMGYRQAMAEANLSVKDGWRQYCRPTVEDGVITAQTLLALHPELSALFCYNDLLAVGALQACSRHGLKVPTDVAIVGFDDIQLAALVTPALTTCRIPRVEVGRQAVELLLRKIQGEELNPRTVIISSELIIRESAPLSA